MAVYEVAQMVAKIGADTSALEARLSKTEEMLKATQQTAERAASALEQSFARSASGVDTVSRELQNLQKEQANLAEYEYRMGLKTTEDYKSFLTQRMTEYKAYTNEWRDAAVQMSNIEKKLQAETTAEIKAQAEIRSNILRAAAISAGGEWKAALRDLDMHQAMSVVTAPKGIYSPAEQEAASARIVQLAKEEAIAQDKASAQEAAAVDKAAKDKVASEERAADQRQQAIANLARFEYEQGNLSAEAYQVFLQRRMAVYEEYTVEWKAASNQLLMVERDMEAARVRMAKEADDAILARERELGAQRAAVEREADEMIGMSRAEFLQKVGQDATKLANNHEGGAGASAVFNGLGNVAAAITVVDAASGAMAMKFNNDLSTIANNTLMTTDDIKAMKDETLKLHADTAQPTDDIAKGFMHIENFGNSAADSIKELVWANKEATATGSQTESIANALAASLHIFGASANEAAGYMDVLHHAAAMGNMTVQQFVDTGGPALAIAAAMKDKFYDAAAAISMLTRSGFNAAEAATQIRSLVAHIADPANAATKNIKAIQDAYNSLHPSDKVNLMFDFSQQGVQAKGLLGILRDIEKATEGRADLVAKMVPALRGGIGGMTLAQMEGTYGNEYQQGYNQLKQLQMSNTGSETQGVFQRQQADPLQHWKEIISTLETKFIPVGEKAEKILIDFEPIFEKGADLVLKFMNAFQKLPQPIQDVVVAFGGLRIIQQITGLLVGLKVPADFSAFLRTVGQWIPNIMKLDTAIGGVGVAGEEAAVGGTALAEVLGGPVAWAVTAVIAVVAGLAIAWNKDFGHIREVTQHTFHMVELAGHDAGQAIGKALKYVHDQFEIVHTVYNTVVSVIANDPRVKAFETAWTTTIDVVKAKFREWGVDISKVVSNAVASLTKFAGIALTAILPPGVVSLLGYVKDLSDRTTKEEQPGGMFNPLPPFTGAGMGRGLAGHGAAPTNSLGVAGPLGAKEAAIADHLDTTADTFHKHCERLANTIRGDTTGLFNRFHSGSAAQTARNLASAGLMMPYTPNMELRPGDQVYSTTLGTQSFAAEKTKGADGHVFTVGSDGSYIDQHGKHSTVPFGANNYQYVFRPDYAKGLLAQGGGAYSGTGDGSEIEAALARIQAAAAEKKRLAHLEKLREQHYKDEVSRLEKAIKVGKQSEDPSNNYVLSGVQADLTTGPLAGTKKKEADYLAGLGARLDKDQHERYTQTLIDHANDKIAAASAPQRVKDTLEAVGIEWDKWKQLSQSARDRLMQFADGLKAAAAITKLKKDQDDAAVREWLSLPENKALAMAVEADGGIEKWKALGSTEHGRGSRGGGDGHSWVQQQYIADAQKRIEAENEKFLRDLQASHQQYIQEWNKKYNPSAYDPGQAAVDDWLKTNPHNKTMEDTIRADAKQKALEDSSAFLESAQQELATSAIKTSHTLTDVHDPIAQAVHSWEDSNQAAIALYLAMGGTTEALKAYEDKLKAQTKAQATADLQLDAKSLWDKYHQDAVAEADYKSPGDKAVAEWEASDKGQDMINTFGKLSDTVQNYEANLKAATNAEDKLNKQLQFRQQLVEGLSTAVMSGINNAFNPNPQQTGEYQTQLYGYQSQMLQTRLDESRWREMNPGDANDPYLSRLQQIQHQIDITKNKLEGMGNTFTNVFKRLFDGILNSFKETVTKIAEAYLQSQLMQLIAGGASNIANHNSGNWIGQVLGGVNTALGFIGTGGGGGGGGKGGGGGGGTTAPFSHPIIDSNYGYGLADDGWNVPGTEGRGDTVKARLAPKEMVLPVPLANAVRSMASGKGGGTTINNYNYRQTVNTPDVRGFRSSRRTLQENVSKAFRR